MLQLNDALKYTQFKQFMCAHYCYTTHLKTFGRTLASIANQNAHKLHSLW